MFLLCTIIMTLSGTPASAPDCHSGTAAQAAEETARCKAAAEKQCAITRDLVDDKGVHNLTFGYYTKHD